jgi:hypothetical protein
MNTRKVLVLRLISVRILLQPQALSLSSHLLASLKTSLSSSLRIRPALQVQPAFQRMSIFGQDTVSCLLIQVLLPPLLRLLSGMKNQ